jgi:excisionase family DNA binding protein
LEDRLLTVKEAAEILRVTEWTIYRLMKRGQLPFIKVGKRFTRIRRRDLEAFLDRYTVGKEPNR